MSSASRLVNNIAFRPTLGYLPSAKHFHFNLTKCKILKRQCCQPLLLLRKTWDKSAEISSALPFSTLIGSLDSLGLGKFQLSSERIYCCFCTKSANKSPKNPLNLSDDACPQGIQGDDCDNYKLWLHNCRRYGLANCNEQLQGIQSGRKTLSEVLEEQEKLIADISQQYRAANNHRNAHDSFQGSQGKVSSGPADDSSSYVHERQDNVQGCQEYMSAFPAIDSPCPQGVQGYDCAQYKLWLENCHKIGLHDCMEQYSGYKAGRKTLAEIFAEQDNMIRQSATYAYQISKIQQRSYSSSAGNPKSPSEATAKGENTETSAGGQLTQRQKLQRAIKEYGSTVIVFHITISLMSLGFFYLLVSSGIDIVGLLTKAGVGGSLLQNKLAAGTGTFVVAYAVHKVFAPVRIATTLTATPFIVRYLRRIGFLKVPKPKA
ncbi:unnamed protein product [Lymnaea stagnalis]|uniref:DUF1279 domain-containing protein n=1 Tax=Lymnaea stagnalis TaxID=6523 RepID=A0AAV2I9Z4_LYMST